MSKYKNLHISKDELEAQINTYCESKQCKYDIVCKLMNEATKQNRYTVTIANNILFDIDAYFRKDCTTSLMPIGKDEKYNYSLDLCEYIYNNLEYINVASCNFSVAIEEENFKMLIDYLSSIDGVHLVDNRYVNNCIGNLYKFRSDIGDMMTLTYYKSSGKLLCQGYLMKLYTEVKCFLSPFAKINTNLSNIAKYNSNDIENEVIKLLPDAYGNIDSMLQDFIYDSVVQMSYQIPCKDYSVWAFSSLKALEGYIKQVLLKNSVRINDKKGFVISCKGQKPRPIFIKSSSIAPYIVDTNLVTINSQNVLRVLSNCYTYFAGNRHVLFHTKQALHTTKILNSTSEARDIIYRV